MRKRVLLIKTSSLGDVIHALPAVSDLVLNGSTDVVDWVVEESFSAIPSLHPSVSSVKPVAVRRWRRTWWQRAARAEAAHAARALGARAYDAVIDLQGLLKSALLSRCARGPRYGLDWRSAREPLGIFYDHTFSIPWSLHAVERNRLLVARAIGYEVPAGCDYGIKAVPGSFDWMPAGQYAVLLHATSGDYKLWPEAHWIALAAKLNDGGLTCVLPWGSASEQARASRIADRVRAVVIAPRLQINDFPGLFAGAQAVVGVDTGLTHLAGALGVPAVGIYCGTDPAATGLHGCQRAENVGGISTVPTVVAVTTALARLWS